MAEPKPTAPTVLESGIELSFNSSHKFEYIQVEMMKHQKRTDKYNFNTTYSINSHRFRDIMPYFNLDMISLELKHLYISEEDLSGLLKKCKKLTKLSLDTCPLISRTIIKSLDQCHKLKQFYFKFPDYRAYGITNNMVTRLRSGSDPGGASPKISKELGHENFKNNTLNLLHKRLSKEKMEDSDNIANLIVKHCNSNLYSLTLNIDANQNRFSLKDPEFYVNNQRLQSLTSTRASMFSVWQNFSLVKEVKKWWLNDTGVAYVAECFPYLKNLNLNECLLLTDETLYAISHNNKGLVKLVLNHSPNFTIEGFQRLAQNCTSIRALEVAWCAKVDDNCIILFVKKFLRLNSLDVSYCKLVTADSLRFIIVYRYNNLQYLNMENTGLIKKSALWKESDIESMKDFEIVICPIIAVCFLKYLKFFRWSDKGLDYTYSFEPGKELNQKSLGLNDDIYVFHYYDDYFSTSNDDVDFTTYSTRMFHMGQSLRDTQKYFRRMNIFNRIKIFIIEDPHFKTKYNCDILRILETLGHLESLATRKDLKIVLWWPDLLPDVIHQENNTDIWFSENQIIIEIWLIDLNPINSLQLEYLSFNNSIYVILSEPEEQDNASTSSLLSFMQSVQTRNPGSTFLILDILQDEENKHRSSDIQSLYERTEKMFTNLEISINQEIDFLRKLTKSLMCQNRYMKLAYMLTRLPTLIKLEIDQKYEPGILDEDMLGRKLLNIIKSLNFVIQDQYVDDYVPNIRPTFLTDKGDQYNDGINVVNVNDLLLLCLIMELKKRDVPLANWKECRSKWKIQCMYSNDLDLEKGLHSLIKKGLIDSFRYFKDFPRPSQIDTVILDSLKFHDYVSGLNHWENVLSKTLNNPDSIVQLTSHDMDENMGSTYSGLSGISNNDSNAPVYDVSNTENDTNIMNEKEIASCKTLATQLGLITIELSSKQVNATNAELYNEYLNIKRQLAEVNSIDKMAESNRLSLSWEYRFWMPENQYLLLYMKNYLIMKFMEKSFTKSIFVNGNTFVIQKNKIMEIIKLEDNVISIDVIHPNIKISDNTRNLRLVKAMCREMAKLLTWIEKFLQLYPGCFYQTYFKCHPNQLQSQLILSSDTTSELNSPEAQADIDSTINLNSKDPYEESTFKNFFQVYYENSVQKEASATLNEEENSSIIDQISNITYNINNKDFSTWVFHLAQMSDPRSSNTYQIVRAKIMQVKILPTPMIIERKNSSQIKDGQNNLKEDDIPSNPDTDNEKKEKEEEEEKDLKDKDDKPDYNNINNKEIVEEKNKRELKVSRNKSLFAKHHQTGITGSLDALPLPTNKEGSITPLNEHRRFSFVKMITDRRNHLRSQIQSRFCTIL
ncbi:uncharacterized protein LOC135922888 isoform X2 [Gordionus sp. m RMFG-2023]|uniref:uncharacterized protein LOC135922888 isoform X2 n=1 Tax=Gordionus sp. m RMFG-2023 TaxID=3053472 RepID=UPI0031FD400A